MMKKLAVTFFVLSLAAFGCGSDDGTPEKKDTGVDSKPDTSMPKLDTSKSDTAMPGPEAGPEAQADMQVKVDQGEEMDGGTVDAEAIDTSAVDVQEIDGGSADKPMTTPDGGAIDGQPAMDGGMAMDGGKTG